MALKKRERILAISTGALLVLFLGKFLWSALASGSSPYLAQRTKLARDVEQRQHQIARSQEAEKQLATWRSRSLPSDTEAASSSYQNWLLASAEAAGFKATKVIASPGRQQGKIFRTLRFSIQAETTLPNLTRFLHNFYSAGYLHQIQSLNLTPREEGQKLDVQFYIETLTLLDVDREKDLPAKPASPLLAADASSYAKAIGDRNMFAPYRKPAPPAAPPSAPPPEFDATKFVFLTGIVAVDDRLEAWITNRTSGKNLTLHQGEEFEVGNRRGKVQQINTREVVIELDGHRCVLSLGKPLEGSGKGP